MAIKTHTEQKTITVYTYETTDGKKFSNQSDAIDYQLRLDGKRKTCPKCNGSKGEKDWGEDGRLPERWIKCDRCDGKGYQDLVEIWQ